MQPTTIPKFYKIEKTWECKPTLFNPISNRFISFPKVFGGGTGGNGSSLLSQEISEFFV
jgi:hypothetical protein